MDLDEPMRIDGDMAVLRSRRTRWITRVGLAVLILLVLVPAIDLGISRLFYDTAGGFVWRNRPMPEAIHAAIQVLARIIGAATLLAFLYTAGRSLWNLLRTCEGTPAVLLGLGPRSWAFLFLGLVLGPGLVANVVLKDMWNRARPVQVAEFGGDQYFSPPMVISNQCEKNCSFVAGDAAMGFYLHIFAYVALRRFAGPLLVAGMAAGLAAGLLRIGMGAHFFSDVIYAGVFMTLTIAGLHAAMFSPRQTLDLWRRWTPWCDSRWPSREGRS
ncbi:phosphatase PAP2 family protein [Skermanella rosea]|uniref:phosphatase PAP2 family protein n=1 Tax=Skermanella rosea TaxID=1817965 RepID=UPI0019330079|nr:phosphatase PAP2 family protein [Skermanella rosea]UEM02208.1 phosphatase PAP2 family protein [Skermanella rosea]